MIGVGWFKSDVHEKKTFYLSLVFYIFAWFVCMTVALELSHEHSSIVDPNRILALPPSKKL